MNIGSALKYLLTMRDKNRLLIGESRAPRMHFLSWIRAAMAADSMKIPTAPASAQTAVMTETPINTIQCHKCDMCHTVLHCDIKKIKKCKKCLKYRNRTVTLYNTLTLL
jgi:hypothetical protein